MHAGTLGDTSIDKSWHSGTLNSYRTALSHGGMQAPGRNEDRSGHSVRTRSSEDLPRRAHNHGKPERVSAETAMSKRVHDIQAKYAGEKGTRDDCDTV
jgi:hypothetical protein